MYKLVNEKGQPVFIFGGKIKFLSKESFIYDRFGYFEALFLSRKHKLEKVKI